MNQPHAATSREQIAFRFLMLCWFASLLILASAAYEHVQAKDAQASVASFSEGVLRCHQQAMDATPGCHDNTSAAERACEAATHHCFDDSVPGYAQSDRVAASERERHEDQAFNAESLAVAVTIGATGLFYGVRWALTGRLRPLWPLRRRKD